MHKIADSVLALAGFLSLAIYSESFAQIPTIQVYFDPGLQYTFTNCPDPPSGIVDTFYVVASNFNAPLSEIEYRVGLYESATYVDDIIPAPHTSIGNSEFGIQVLFGEPFAAIGPTLVQEIVVIWVCELGCVGVYHDIVVEPHFATGNLQAITWDDGAVIDVTGLGSSVCGGTIPVAETSWGKIKALYDN